MARRLLLLSVEGLRLVGRRLLHNPAAHKALITANLVQGQPTLLHLDTNFYTNLVVGLLPTICYAEHLLTPSWPFAGGVALTKTMVLSCGTQPTPAYAA